MHRLFFLLFIYRFLNYLELENFPLLELVHITSPIGATFLRQWYAQRKPIELSVGTSKRPRVDVAAIGEMPAEEIHIDHIAAMDPNIADVEPIVPLPLSLHAMMETFMTTQVAHEQLFHLLHPLILDDCFW